MDSTWHRTWPETAELHICDPEGDILFILERYQVDDSEERGPPEAAPLSEGILDWPAHEPDPVQYDSQVETAESEVDGLTKPEIPACGFLAKRELIPRVEKVQLRASSKHLILASSTFRSSLSSDTYLEGRALRNEGNLVIPLPGDDPDSMIILLNVIHGLSSKVPRRVDLNMLSKLAVAVNHRHIHEAVGICPDTWIENLKRDDGFPSSYRPEILTWLFILWVFRKDEDFRNISQILERESDYSLKTELETVCIGPYIPASIIRNIQENRINAIESMIAVIYDLITKYSGPNILCTGNEYSCDATLLGSLLKASAIIGIWPRPKDPYPGINAKMLAGHIRGMQVLDDCERFGRGYYQSSNGSHGIKVLIEASMKSLEAGKIPGLQLASFLPKAKKTFRKCSKIKNGSAE
ncbi:uncharacterized protein RAG0_03050 [Rhynchosporium agropyri]|uniref:BTB domain-containing protein n=1 Tax=Rhynchosporium agropyri TaxID=914238 RepID=A0A1E1K394_9HELO|nr:uncharacterized protein RAG0_03050 [Rhynchosporium agropyri]